MLYYAQRKSIKNGEPIFNNRTGTRREMLRQYFLYCASAATNEAENDFDFIEFGTIEQGSVKVESFNQDEPTPEEVTENV